MEQKELIIKNNDLSLVEENLRLKLALVATVQQFYNYRITPEEAKEYNVFYDPDDEMVECYFHMFESAGESAWEMLGFHNPIVSEREMYKLTKSIKDELLKLHYNKSEEYKDNQRIIKVIATYDLEDPELEGAQISSKEKAKEITLKQMTEIFAEDEGFCNIEVEVTDTRKEKEN